MKPLLLALALLAACAPAAAQAPPPVLVRLDPQALPSQFANIDLYNQHVAAANANRRLINRRSSRAPLYFLAAVGSFVAAYALYEYGEEQYPEGVETEYFFTLTGSGALAGIGVLFLTNGIWGLGDNGVYRTAELHEISQARALFPNLNVNLTR